VFVSKTSWGLFMRGDLEDPLVRRLFHQREPDMSVYEYPDMPEYGLMRVESRGRARQQDNDKADRTRTRGKGDG
jgi:hypothetical protein